FCGEREESEFHQGGEAHIVRPKDPDELSDAEWADYLFLRKNTKGLFLERWVHLHGCRRWFNMARNTATNEIIAVYKMGAQPPKAAINKPPKTAVDKPPKAVGKGAKK
ncbi:MAG: sarcosine oxidase subunit delta, partial [Rhodospirillaceae bacterium]|nr:sarcosine oxidase subunit delta [Rhodospirillaceae bacterium]